MRLACARRPEQHDVVTGLDEVQRTEVQEAGVHAPPVRLEPVFGDRLLLDYDDAPLLHETAELNANARGACAAGLPERIRTLKMSRIGR